MGLRVKGWVFGVSEGRVPLVMHMCSSGCVWWLAGLFAHTHADVFGRRVPLGPPTVRLDFLLGGQVHVFLC